MADENEKPADSPSPYYISPDDRTTDVLLPFSLSPDGKNYLRWSECMLMALVFKGKQAFIDGTLPPPEKDSPEFAIWCRCDELVRSWICNSIERNSNLYATVIYSKFALDLWGDLHQLFYLGTPVRIYEVMAEISCLKQGELTVAEYYTKLKSLWNQLDCYLPGCSCECGAEAYEKVKDSERLCQFLIGLESDKFRTAKFRILNSESLPSLKEAYSMVVLEEKMAAMRI